MAKHTMAFFDIVKPGLIACEVDDEARTIKSISEEGLDLNTLPIFQKWTEKSFIYTPSSNFINGQVRDSVTSFQRAAGSR